MKKDKELTIQIEKNIPVPKGIRRKYPFNQMEIGDSFFGVKPTLSKLPML